MQMRMQRVLQVQADVFVCMCMCMCMGEVCNQFLIFQVLFCMVDRKAAVM